MSTAVAPKGLEGIVATSSSICWIDGDAGVLSYRGIDIHELAERSTFEETTYLLWFGKLPNATQLAEFTANLSAARKLDPKIIDLLRSVPIQRLRGRIPGDDYPSLIRLDPRRALRPTRASRDQSR